MIELRISAPGFKIDELLDLLVLLELEASVASTTNLCKSSTGHLQKEAGAHVLLPACDRSDFVSRVWPVIKETFALRCGWVDASDRGFRGCTENFCMASRCPSRLPEAPDSTRTDFRFFL